MKGIVLPLVLGLQEGSVLVLVAMGLSLTFGVMRIVNLAHGGFVALGAFLVYSLNVAFDQNIGLAVVAVAITVAAAGVLGVVLERFAFRRLYAYENIATLLVTFALLQAFNGAVVQVWGNNPVSQPYPTGLAGSVSIAGVAVPSYDLVIIGVAILAVILVALFLHRTRLGQETRVVALDRSMAALLGVNTRRVFAVSFMVGSGLAGLAGALIAPTVSIDNTLSGSYVIEAFAVLLIGGLGNMWGAVVVALVLGIIDAIAVIHVPSLSGYAVYVAMIAALVLRPHGLGTSSAEVHI
jgi:branched-subunit amino acid ABC-type transport system permease component